MQKGALRNKKVVPVASSLLLQKRALQPGSPDSPARKLQTRPAQRNQPLRAGFPRHKRNVSAAPPQIVGVGIEYTQMVSPVVLSRSQECYRNSNCFVQISFRVHHIIICGKSGRTLRRASPCARDKDADNNE